ncbi:non-ribosomal peptide synthetase [Methylovulum psychrotolerans]|uniref:Non-ribosomal peptide synthetase n=2 Tax=Methylovulum psychrotolerans TaxID=1704499 RepID=A0A2S5CKA1_9GAMM|nr:non-ribosomal peptide synthetase [Methylovulum psychrotolerans]
MDGLPDAAGQGGDDLNPDPQALGLTPEHLAYVIYTSGSTGQPKGVMNGHRGVVNRLCWAQQAYGLSATDRVLQKTPFSFDVSVWEFFLPLLAGAQLVIAKPHGHQDPAYLAQLLVREQVSMVHFVPSMLQVFLDQTDLPACPALRRVLCSGEALPHALQMRCHRIWPDVELHNLYGPTEAAVDVTAWRCSPEPDLGIVPIGYPIANTQIYILDHHLQPVPLGVAGEIHIGGIQVARGYLNRPALTAERFITDPFRKDGSGRLYKTGDLGGWLPNGSIEYLGRNDFQVKIRGLRIELGEIETRLAAYPGIREAVVIAREDMPGDKRLIAYLIPETGHTPDPGELRRQLAGQLADYMLPSAFVTLEQFPLSTNGKLDRKALPAPDGKHLRTNRPYTPPRTHDEEVLAAIWAQILGLEQVGIDDGFFDLGGDSLRTIQVLNLAKQRGLTFSLAELYQHNSIRALLANVRGDTVSHAPVIAPFALLTAADRQLLPAHVEDAYPLTALQAGMVYHSGMDSKAYHLVDSIVLQCPWNSEVFNQVIRQVCARHPVLRTAIVIGQFSEPLQWVFAEGQTAIPVGFDDWSGFPDTYQQHLLDAWLAIEKQQVFTLSQAPLARIHIHKLSATTFHFALTEHHVILDGWSVVSLLNEIFTCYLAALKAEPLAITAPANVLRDLVVCERQALQAAATRQYWQRQVAAMPDGELPVCVQASPPPEAVKLTVHLTPALTQGLQALARSLSVPLKTVLLTAHLKVLTKLYGKQQVTTGLVCSIRPEVADADRALGVFLNTLPLVTGLKPSSWRELAVQVFTAERELLQHRFYPLAEIQRTHQRPLFGTMFHYLHYHVAKDLAQSEDLQVLAWDDFAPTLTPLLVAFQQDIVGQQLSLSLFADQNRFTAAQAGQIAGYFLNILTDMADNPWSSHTRQSFLSPEEQHNLLTLAKGTNVDDPQSACLPLLFEQQAAQRPDDVAVSCAGQTLRYGELNRRANRLAHRLLSLGVRPEDRVAVYAGRSVAMVVSLLAILKAGGAYLPLDPSLPAQRLAYLLQDSQAVLVLAQAELLSGLPTTTTLVPLLALDAAGRVGGPADYPAHNPALPLTGGHLAYIMYTSGSTGQPKGVMVNHGNVVNLINMTDYAPITPQDCVAHCANPAFDASTWEIWAALLNGARLAIIAQDVVLQAPDFNNTLINEGATALWLTAGLFHQYLDVLTPAFARLSYLLVGGDVVDSQAVSRLLASGTGPAHLINGYGPTETTTFASTYQITAATAGTPIPIGRPIANCHIVILDANLHPVPQGVTGELYIGGAGVARAYLNRPDLTAERFIADPYSRTPHARLYKTGDLGRWLPDGNIAYSGRDDRQVKIRGFRVELDEIAAQLSQLPNVQAAVVSVREDSVGDKRLVAYIIPESGYGLNIADLRQQLAAQLADYMLPSAFVVLDAFPLTANGKLDRQALPPPDVAEQLQHRYAEPRTPTEQTLAAMWAQLLNVQRVGINDSFIELGGHSLIATQLMSRVGLAFAINLPLKTLFEANTVAQLAKQVDLAVWLNSQTSLPNTASDVEYEDIAL